MAACIYVVVVSGNKPTSRLLCAKTRLAPTKTQSVPRLELQAMLLGAQLLTSVQQALASTMYLCTRVDAYTDSTVALAWAKSEPARWNVFVANRVTKIQELTSPDMWRHVPGEENPADLGTRPNAPPLQGLDRWWHGPPWLLEKNHWIPQPRLQFDQEIDRKKVVACPTVLSGTTPPPLLPVDKISDYGRLVKVVKIVLRVLRIKTPNAHRAAIVFLIKQEQGRFYQEELALLRRGDEMPPGHPFRKLHPVLAEDGTMRVGGRLTFADLPEDAKRPFIIPSKSPLPKLLARHIHITMYHAGAATCRNEMRKKFWVTGQNRS